MFAATDLNAVPADFLKNLAIALVVLLGVALSILGIANFFMRRSEARSAQPRTIADQPLEVDVRQKSRRFNSDACDGRHSDIERRLAENEKRVSAMERQHGEQLGAIKTEMHAMELRINAADEERTTGVHVRVNQILDAVSETRGTLGQVSKSLDALAAEVRRK